MELVRCVNGGRVGGRKDGRTGEEREVRMDGRKDGQTRRS